MVGISVCRKEGPRVIRFPDGKNKLYFTPHIQFVEQIPLKSSGPWEKNCNCGDEIRG